MKRKKETASEAGAKSIKVDGAMDKKKTSEETRKFVCQVQSLLGTQQTKLSGLTKLRDALQKSHNSELVYSFLKQGAECQDIFNIWEGGRHNLSQLEIQICLEVLESILLFTASENQPSTKSDMPVVQKLLQNHMKLLYSCLNPGGPPEVTTATLRLLTAMVAQGTSAARDVQRAFDFTLKSLQLLANRRDKKAVQDTRTCFINFCLSFLVFGDVTVQKQTLELKGFLQSIMRGLNNDLPVVVRAVLSTLNGKVVENIGITKKIKVQFFNAHVLSQVATLYQYTRDSEDDKEDMENNFEQTIRCHAHELLLKICTTFKYGICFFNKTGAFSIRSNNPVLLRFLRNIASAASSDVLLQELVVKALLCCQDLVKPFLSSLTVTYEPRLSMPWIANMNLLKKIYTMLPQPSQMVKKAGVEMTANMIPFLMDVVVPVGVSRTVFSHGIQHASSFVRHTTLSLLTVILERAEDAAVCVACAGEPKLDHTLHPAVPLLQNFREEVFKVLPDVKTVIALRQNIVAARTVESPQDGDTINSTILVAQSLKVIHGLQRLWPPILSHASFDLSKLLPGQHDMSDTTFPPIVQHLTLQILLYSPAGSLKWYQQKQKRGTSFVYKVLDLCGSVKDENIRKGAKLLLSKLLHETGLLDNKTAEVDIWLSHLHSCMQRSEDRQTLQSFLGEVFTAVAVEPYVYTDIIVELQSEAMMMEANAGQFDETLINCNGSTQSLPASPMVIRALIQYAQMFSSAVQSSSEAAVRSLSCIACYMNLVVCDMLHSVVNPTILCFAVSHYYEKIVVPVAWAGIRSTHRALLNHVKYWIGDDAKIGDLQVHTNNGNTNLKALRTFLKSSAVNSDQETRSALGEFCRLLEPLDEHDLRASIGDCLHFCKKHLAGNLSPLVKSLSVKCFKIIGSLSSETLVPLLECLPFSVLLWQLLGPTAEEDTANLCQNSCVQGLVMAALEKEPLSRTIPLCFHILLHLRTLTRKLFNTRIEREQSNMRSSILLCFQAIEFLLQRFIEQCPKDQNIKTSLSAGAPTEEDDRCTSGTFHEQCDNNTVLNGSKHEEEGFCNIVTVSHAVLQHPVMLQCFLPESPIVSDLICHLTYSVTNLLLAVVAVPGLAPAQKKQLVRPFVDKFCCAAKMEVQALQKGNEQSSEMLHLFGLFHEFCNRDTVMEFISSLSQLPPRLLLNIGSITKDRKPSVYLHALLLLLDGVFCGVDHLSININSNSKSETEEQIILEAFKRLVIVSTDFPCSRLDSAILKLLKTSMVFVFATPTTYLDSCLDHPTESKVNIACTLIAHSAMFRSHLELRCISGSGEPKASQPNDDIPLREPIMFEDHLLDYCPLVCSYLACINRLDEGSCWAYNSRRRNVISCLFNLYWATSWKWVLDDKETGSKHSKDCCVKLLVALVGSHAVQQYEALGNAFNDLLLMASSWDSLQQRLCRKLLSCLCQNHCTSEEQSYLTGRFVFACMESISDVLTREVPNEQWRCYLEDSLYHLAMVCKSGSPISTDVDGCATIWKNFVHIILRVKFESIEVHRTLVVLVKALYKKVGSRERLPTDLLSLGTLYEMLLSHSGFLDVMLGRKQAGKCDLKEALVELMITVVELKGDCCKPSHLRILFAAYSASMSLTDRSILYLLQLYEKNHTSFRNNRPFLWGPAAVAHHQSMKDLGPSLWQQPSVSEVLELVDVSRMNRSGVQFPRSRHLQPEVQKELRCGEDLYDPCFLLPLFSCLLASNYELDCRKFVERGCLGFTVASLSSRAEHMRQAGYHVLVRFMTHLEGARFKERKQIFHLLNCLRSGITTSNCRLPSVTVCFLARAAHILLRPEHSLYVMVNSFLLQRPALDVRDVPLFYTMFNSSSMQHVAERSWMLELLVDGMKDSPDYYVYKRRHVIELTLSFHDSQASDHNTQNMVTHLLLSALKIQPAAYDLVKNYGVVAWIHSLCLKSPAARNTCLTLVHSLWFTLHHGKLGNSDHITTESSDKVQQPQVSLPPNLAQECALVCWSLLEQLRLNPDVNETSRYFQVLGSIVDYLRANEQSCGLSRDRILSLICLWCVTFDETDALNRLLSSVNLAKVVQAGASCGHFELKTNGLFSLSGILFAWQPLTGTCHETVLLVWRFGLHFLLMSFLANKQTNKFRSRGEPSLAGNQKAHCSTSGGNSFLGDDILSSGKRFLTSLPANRFSSSGESTLRPDTSSFVGTMSSSHLSLLLLRWLRKCLVRDRALQTFLVTSDSVSDIRRFLELFRGYCTDENNVLPEARGERINQALSVTSWSAVVLEVNVVCLVLLTAVKRVVQQESEANLPTMYRLISQEPYKKIIAEGLEKVVFPFYPHPGEEMTEMRCHEQGDILQHLVCLFMQEFWFERQLPSHFLSFLLNNKNDPHGVVEKLIEALGGEDVIAEWMSV